MNFLLDTDTCSAHMRRPAKLAHRFIQYAGGLAIPTIVLAELYAGAYKHPSPAKLLSLIADLLMEVQVLEFDAACAERFGQVRGSLLQQGITVSRMDLLIAAVALVHNLTLGPTTPRTTRTFLACGWTTGSFHDRPPCWFHLIFLPRPKMLLPA